MESIQNIVAAVYVLLQGGVGRLTQNELDWNDVLEVGTDVMRGFVRDAALSHREQRTQIAEVTLDCDSDGDYRVIVPGYPDYEPLRLQYQVSAGTLAGWGDVNITDMDAFSQFYNSASVYGAFFGSTATPGGLKLRLNLLTGDIGGRCWRLEYRLPLFAQLQLGDRPTLPIEFMRMVKLAWAIACVPIVKLSKEKRLMWNDWKRDTLVQYVAELRGWNSPDDPVNPGRWQEYLNGGKGSIVQDVPRFDQRRLRNGAGNMRGVVGPGGTWGVRGRG